MDIKTYLEDGVCTLLIDREEKLNTISPDMFYWLTEAFREVDRNDEVDVLLITSRGERLFSAGMDLKIQKTLDRYGRYELIRSGRECIKALMGVNKPTIAAVNGICLGGGLEIALATDYIIAVEDAEIGLPEMTIGFIPTWGGIEGMLDRLPITKAKEMVYFGKRISGREASGLGIVSESVTRGEFENRVKEVCFNLRDIARENPYIFEMCKNHIREFRNKGNVDSYVVDVNFSRSFLERR